MRVLQLCFYYFALSVFNERGIHFSRETKQRDTTAFCAFTPVSIVVYRDDQFANLSVPLQNAMALDTHESAKPFGVLL